ncbi:MAG: hypothetical protein EOP85_03510 [Verrucomicrobiaceae bacterium]|nr:MAG: hypothetical protein EOP85_03510 [Verrucomicrobiaceae bacterium]
MNVKSLLVLTPCVVAMPARAEEAPAAVHGDAVAQMRRCVEDNGSFETWMLLLDAGDRVYPALAEELLRTRDPLMVRGIATLFQQSAGDKAVPLEAMRTFVKQHAREDPPLVQPVIMAMGAIGTMEDADFLREYLDGTDPAVARAAEEGTAAILLRAAGASPGVPVPEPTGLEKDDKVKRAIDRTMVWAWVAVGVLAAIRIALVVARRRGRW